MKNKFIYVFLFIVFSFLLVGCGENPKFKNEISINCTLYKDHYQEVYGDLLSANITVNAIFNKYGYITKSDYKNVEKSATEEVYLDRKDSNNPEYIDPYDDTKIEFNDKERTITYTNSIELNYLNFSKEDRKDMEIKNYISSLEKAGYKCDINGATRKEIGLK